MEVEYRTLADFPGYRVGDDGSIWSCRTFAGTLSINWRKLKLSNSRDAALIVTLHRNGQRITRSVARLILQSFAGPAPEGMECCHNDGDFRNNSIGNLRWDTHQSNIDDKDRHGTTVRGEMTCTAKLRDSDVLAIRRMASEGIAIIDIAKTFGVSQASATRVVSGRGWSHLPGAIPTDKRRTVLSESALAQIRNRLNAGESIRRIANDYPLDRRTISKIRDGEFAA